MAKTVVIIRNASASDFGGGERFPVFLAEELYRLGYCTYVVSRSRMLLEFAHSRKVQTIRGWWWQNQNWNGARASLFPVYFVWQCLLFFYYFLLFIKLAPSVVHIQSKDDFIAGTFAARALGIRVVWTDHADLKHIWQNNSIWYKNPTGKFVYLAANFSHAITVVSKSELHLVSQHLSPNSAVRNKLYVVYNGVFDDRSHIKQVGHFGLTYIVASRLVRDKGIGEVIEAFNLLSEQYDDIELHLIGDGPEAEVFKKQALNNKRIFFEGYQTNPLGFIANADVFVHPTYHEGFSVALVEASMLARPIIATSVGGNPEIITDMKTGLLVPLKDSSALYGAMKRVYDDPRLRRRLGDAAREQYEKRFNFSSIVSSEFIPIYCIEADKA